MIESRLRPLAEQGYHTSNVHVLELTIVGYVEPEAYRRKCFVTYIFQNGGLLRETLSNIRH